MTVRTRLAASAAESAEPTANPPKNDRRVGLKKLRMEAQSRHDRSHRNARDLGDFLIREIIHFAQHDGFAEGLGQLLYQTAYRGPVLLLQYHLFRRSLRLLPHRHFLSYQFVLYIIGRHLSSAAPCELGITHVP